MDVALILAPAWLTANSPGNMAKIAAAIKNAGCYAHCFDFNIELYQLIKKTKLNKIIILVSTLNHGMVEKEWLFGKTEKL